MGSGLRRVLASAVAGALIGSLAPVGVADAGTQSYTGVLNPGALGVAFPSTGAWLAVGNDGTIFVGATAGVRASTNGGVSFGAAVALPGGTPPVAIVPSPSFATDRIVAAVTTVAGGAQVSIALDGGATFPASQVLTGAPIGAPGDVAMSLAIAPNFTSANGGLIAVGVNPAGATASVFVLSVAGAVTASHITSATGAPGTAAGALGGSTVNGTSANGALAVAFSPQFTSDGLVFAVVDVTGAVGPLGSAGTWENRGTLGGGLASATLVHAGDATSAKIAFPSDFNASLANSYFVATSGSAASSLFRRVAGAWVDATPVAGAPTPISGLAVSGPFATATVFVGATASNGPGSAGQAQIARSNDGGASWLPASGIGGSNGLVNVAVSPSFPTDATVYATTKGVQGGFWFSAAGGSTSAAWSARGLHLDAYSTITQIAAAAPAADPLFAILAGPGAGDDAVFRTTSGPSTAATWTRTGYIAGVDVAAIALSRNFAVDNTVFIGGGAQLARSTNQGASFSAAFIAPIPAGAVSRGGIAAADASTVFVAAGSTVHTSADGGASWASATLPGAASIQAIRLSPAYSSDHTVLVAAITPVGAAQVFISTDAGATFNLVGAHPDTGPGVARHDVAFDSGYATTRAVYSATGGNLTRQNVYRWVAGSSATWQTLSAGADSPGAAPALANGMNASNVASVNGVLYASSAATGSATASGIRRALNPTAGYDGATASQWFDLGWAGLAGVGVSQPGTGKLDQEGTAGGGFASNSFTGPATGTLGRSNAGMVVVPATATMNLVLVVDTTAAGATAPMTANIYAYTDTLLPAPQLAAPADGAYLTAAPALSWSPYAGLGAAAFTARVSTDPAFQDPANTVYANVAAGVFSLPHPASLAFTPGRGFYWQVRAADNAGQNVPSPWSAVRQYAAVSATASSTSFSPVSVTLPATGNTTTITVHTVGVGTATESAQINIQHGANVAIGSPACAGIFGGGTATAPSSVTGGTVIGCTLPAGAVVSGGTGNVMTLVVTRTGGGLATLSFGVGGPLRTQFKGGSTITGPGTTNTVQIGEATLTVNEATIPATDQGRFSLLIDGVAAGAGGDVGNGGTTGMVQVSAGSHTVSETAVSGTSLADYATAIGGDCGADGTLTLAPGDNRACTITNTRLGSITIMTDSQPDDALDFSFTTTGAGLAPFSLDDDFDATLPSSRTFSRLAAGSYTVTEGAVGGWALASIACNPSSGTVVDVAGRKATISLAAGAVVTCTFVNSKLGSITIVKSVEPNDPQHFSFTGTGGIGTFSLDVDNDPTLPSLRTFGNLPSGAYTVTEAAVAGWALVSITCTPSAVAAPDVPSRAVAITLAAGANVTCTFINGRTSQTLQAFTGVMNPGRVGEPASTMVVAVDGTILVGAGAAGVRSSSNGGVSFSAAVGLPGGIAPVAIAPSAHFPVDRTVFAVGTVAGGGSLVASFDAGATWSVVTSGPIGAPGDLARSLSVAPNFSTGSGGLVLVGVDPAGATSSVFVVTITGAQTTAATVGGATRAPLPGSLVDAAGNGALAVAFSPQFAGDGVAFAVVAAGPGGSERGFVGVSELRVSLSNAFSPAGTFIHPGNATGARIAFPSDYSVAGADNYFVSTTGAAASSLFRRVAGAWVDTIPGGSPIALTGLAVFGPFASATLFAGATAPTAAPAQAQVFRSNNGGVSWLPVVLVGGSAGAVDLALARASASDSAVYATTAGVQGGFWFSTSGGSTSQAWSSRGLFADAYTTITQIAAAPVTANPLFAILAGPGTGDDAVFRTVSGVSTAAAWTRTGYIPGVDVAAIGLSRNFAMDNTVFIGGGAQLAKSTNGGRSFSVASITPLPSGTVNPGGIVVADGNTVFVAASGTVHRTTDSGNTWTSSVTLSGAPAIRQIVLSPAYAGDNTVLVAAVMPSGAAQVFISTDAGLTFTLVGMHPDTGPGVTSHSVAFDSGYAANRAIYSGTGGNPARQNVYRWVLGASAAWQALGAGANNPGGAPTLAAGMSVSNLSVANGALYASSGAGGSAATSGVRRALNPTAAYDGAIASQWFDLGWAGPGGVNVSAGGTGKLDQEGSAGGGFAPGSFTGAATATLGRSNADVVVVPTGATTNLVLVVDITAAGATAPMTANIYAYLDALLAAPAPASPAPGASLAAAPSLAWGPYAALAAAAFTARVSTDPAFQDAANTVYTNVAPGVFSVAHPASLAFTPGRVFHWQVRAADSAGQNVQGPWSAVRSYSAAVSAGATISGKVTLQGRTATFPAVGHGIATVAISGGTRASDISNFTLENLSVMAGTTVTWTNRDGVPHQLASGTSPNPDGQWAGPVMNQNGAFSQAFANAGSVPYFCRIHPSMQGVVTVVNVAVNVAADGTFQIPAVAPGTYTITASAPGYMSAQRIGLVVGSTPVTMTEVQLHAGLVNSDTVVNIQDISATVASFGTSLANRVDAQGRFVDQNGDGFCNIQDISLVVSSFGQSSPQPWP